MGGHAVLDALESCVRDWYLETGGRPLTAAEERMVRFYSHETPRRAQTLLGPLAARFAERAPGMVLDVGSGYGSIPCWLAAQWPSAFIQASDVDDRFYKVGRAAAAMAGLDNIALRSVPLGELDEQQRYDLVLSCNMLNFMNTKASLTDGLERLWRAARPGGAIAVYTPHYWSLREPFTGIPGLQHLPLSWQDSIARRTGKRSLMTDNRHPSLGEISRVFRRLGARMVDVQPASPLRRFRSTHIMAWFEK